MKILKIHMQLSQRIGSEMRFVDAVVIRWVNYAKRAFFSALILCVTLQSHVIAESFQFSVMSDVFGQPRNIDFELVLPDDVPFIRGLAFNIPGRCGSWIGAFNEPFQKAAVAVDFGILTLDNGDLRSSANPNCHFGDGYTDEPERLLNAALQAAADVSARPHLVNAPVGLIGYSMGGLESLILMGHDPQRFISLSSVRGVSPVFPGPFPAGFKKIPSILMAGSVDTVVPPETIEAGFDDYRSQDAEAAYLMHWTQGHSDSPSIENGGQSVEMSWYWLAELIRARYPTNLVLSNEPGNLVELVDIDIEAGWLADTPRLTPSFMASPFPEINPYAEYSGDPDAASWLPNEAVSNVYRAFASYDPTRPNPLAPGQFLGSPLEFTSPGLFYLEAPLGQFPNYVVGDTIPVSIDPHGFDDVNAITKIEFYNGDTLLDIDTTGPDWGTDFVPTEAGLHALVAVATDDQGNWATNFRVVVVTAVPEPATGIQLMAWLLIGVATSRRQAWFPRPRNLGKCLGGTP